MQKATFLGIANRLVEKRLQKWYHLVEGIVSDVIEGSLVECHLSLYIRGEDYGSEVTSSCLPWIKC